MELLDIDGLDGKVYTLFAYSKALKCKIRLVIWMMPNGKHKLFFSNDTSMTGEEVLKCYRTRFQIEFCFYDKWNIMRSRSQICIENQTDRVETLPFNFS